MQRVSVVQVLLTTFAVIIHTHARPDNRSSSRRRSRWRRRSLWTLVVLIVGNIGSAPCHRESQVLSNASRFFKQLTI
jgi:hypothetical protein